MRKRDVEIGGVYLVKVNGRVQPVRIDAESARGGWIATNPLTMLRVRIESAQELIKRLGA